MALGAGAVLAASIAVVVLVVLVPGAGHGHAHRASPASSPSATRPAIVAGPATSAGAVSPLGGPDVPDARHQAVPTAGGAPRAGASDPERSPHLVRLGATPKGWTALALITGTGDGHSAVFHLSGVATQLRYASDSSSLVVYLLDARRGLDATAGYADVKCPGPCREEHMPLVDGAGDYELVVRATGGAWAVSIEEYRAGRTG